MSKNLISLAISSAAILGLAIPMAAQAGDKAKDHMAQPSEIPPPTMDTNKDGKPDAWDRDGNGAPDAWDVNGDGKPDLLDNDGDGKPDKDSGKMKPKAPPPKSEK